MRENYNLCQVLHLLECAVGEAAEEAPPPVSDEYIPPQSYDFEEARKLGYVVVTGGGAENVSALDEFIADWDAGRDGLVYVIKEGRQGKALATCFISKDGQLTAYNDYSQIGGEVLRKEYADIGAQVDTEGLQYYVTDSDGEGYFLFRIRNGSALEKCSGTVIGSTEREDGILLLTYGTTNGQQGQKIYLNIFVDGQTEVTRSGAKGTSADIKLGDEIEVWVDPSYMADSPNTVRAATVSAKPPQGTQT